jgi:endo-1,4-beta-xylanase
VQPGGTIVAEPAERFTMLSRRDTLKGGACGLAALSGLFAPAPLVARVNDPVGFGAAVRPPLLESDADYANAIRKYCSIVVPEGGLIWNDLRPDRATFDFAAADRVAAFAMNSGLRLRGHTLVWYGVMPSWTESLTSLSLAQDELLKHIDTVVSRYRSRIDSWIVVNEPLADDAAAFDDLRPTIWQRAIGIDHLAMAFEAAHAADPAVKLFINEYDVEYTGARFRSRRKALTALIRFLLDRNVPVHGVGLQAHLRGNLTIDVEGLQQFAAEMKALGLKIAITELDVIDNKLPADSAERDRQAAQRAQTLLAALSDGASLDSVLTWGITDKYTWVPTYFKRADGLKNRPLPLDENYAPKPLMQTIAQFCTVPGI